MTTKQLNKAFKKDKVIIYYDGYNYHKGEKLRTWIIIDETDGASTTIYGNLSEASEIMEQFVNSRGICYEALTVNNEW